MFQNAFHLSDPGLSWFVSKHLCGPGMAASLPGPTGAQTLSTESPLRPLIGMLKQSASGVLASLRDSTYRSVRLVSSLAAALLDSLFEHPESEISLSWNGSVGI